MGNNPDPIDVREVKTIGLEVTGQINLPAGAAAIQANGTETITISNVGPTGVGTATIARWLKIRNSGVDYFIPMWT